VRVQYDTGGIYRVLQAVPTFKLRPSTILLNNAMRALGEHSDAAGACRVFDQMHRAGIQPDRVSYNSLLYALARRGNASKCGMLFFKRYLVVSSYTVLLCT
jgi:pentatricopeptide repeat protein